MKKWWDCNKLDLFFEKIMEASINKRVNHHKWLLKLKSILFNLQSTLRSKEVIDKHYDLDYELFSTFLDPYNQYTCGYFKNTTDLDTAQIQKMDLICKKLQIKPGEKVLDIGCGWGGFAKYAAEHYGCHVTGITISEKQAEYARQFTKGLPVTILKQDYRELKGKFDKIVIAGMIEHVGYKNYRKLIKIVNNCLKEDGLFLLHTIGQNHTSTHGNPWVNKYIFPNGMTPSVKQITTAYESIFTLEDWHNFGLYYADTLMAWDEKFQKNWPKIAPEYSETFYRMWRYYLTSYAAAFKTHQLQLWQIVFSKGGDKKVYESVR